LLLDPSFYDDKERVVLCIIMTGISRAKFLHKNAYIMFGGREEHGRNILIYSMNLSFYSPLLSSPSISLHPKHTLMVSLDGTKKKKKVK
jgi:hypothetical protein